ncbi:hypothetical protein RclHR1_01430025 [Rhizophagus clarus]|uniref:Protein kinase domain-containing protein n=2 Tax=Rhizophagus clarus TaxID=94130 RepID=A0A2Z6R4V4_9GLOM|nr:hypothetical protein RclHR1_01430025 [Rhizophagus clarus]
MDYFFIKSIRKLIKLLHVNKTCEKCNFTCNAIHFQHNFENWTSGNEDIDKFIQDTQLSAHDNVKEALEWIPYDRLYDIKYIAEKEFDKVYSANWIDGNISLWDDENQNWKRINHMFVILKSLNNPKNITMEFSQFTYENTNKPCGITQDPETKNYMFILNNICKKCNYVCNAMHFQQNFRNWTSGNNNIDKFIQDDQLSTHDNYNIDDALEWIPYNRFHDIKYIAKEEFSKVYRASWIDGNIDCWDDENKNWKRINHNMFVILRSLNNPKNISTKLKNENTNKPCGITQDPETKNYMIVLNNNICKKCNCKCNAIHFQQNFKNWASGNKDIDKFIQNTQLSIHDNYEIFKRALEWIPYNKFYYIKCIAVGEFGKVYRANWIDGNIGFWDDVNKNWKRINHNTFVILKSLNGSRNISLKFKNEINKPCGITQDPETKNYMMVLNVICKKCNYVCNAIHFQQNFKNWTSGNNNVNKFIRDSQLSVHDNYNINDALEWIPYNRLHNIKCVAKEKFGKVYGASWIDGNIDFWDDGNKKWKRINYNMFVILKSLNNPENILMKFKNKHTNRLCGITQDPKTKNYMMVLNNNICEKCNRKCNAMHFQQNFKNWTSSNNYVDKFIQDTQLSAHDNAEAALEWIPYDKFYNVKYIANEGFDEVYRANWIDGSITFWDDESQNWQRINSNMFVILKSLNDSINIYISVKFANESTNKPCGITQDPVTKNYMMVLNNICKECNYICNSMHFQQNFENWTSGNNDINKYIQDTQLSAHYNMKSALEWIPYSRLHNIKCIAKEKLSEMYRANWIDGNISNWDDENQNWERIRHNTVVILKSLNDLESIAIEFANEINKPYGITQDLETKNYMMVLSNICKVCNCKCNAIHFQQNFENWTSGDSNINKFIRDTQLLAHDNYNIDDALEWIPYDRFYNIKYIAEEEEFSKVYSANWVDGNISFWDDENQNWERINHNMFVILKSLNNLKNISMKFKNKNTNKSCGITQDPETKNYMMVLNNMCKECNHKCNAMHFQQNFKNWTSGNNDIDKFIQDTQLSAHHNAKLALEWIPYDKFCNIKCITKKFDEEYRANWIDGNINFWDNENQNWERMNHNMVVILKRLNNPKNISMEFTYEVNKFYGITQNPETEDYMVVLDDVCEKCNYICSAKTFHRNFRYWTSGNNDIDKIIQNTQLSIHDNYEIFKKALEWIPYDRFCNIKYIAQGGFGKIYIANWIDGYLNNWNYGNKTWNRYNKNMLVALKSLDNSKNATSEFINEIMLHNKGKKDNNFIIGFYGITQNPETKNYTMVLDYAEGGSLRSYLNEKHSELNWNEKICCLQNAIFGLEFIHEKELIHRDLHIGNILKLKYKTVITDMGLCKPANYNASENAKNTIFGVLPYIAPEVLKGKKYTKAADIYSFGIIMYEVISGLPPYHDLSHDEYLAIKICHGLRPTFKIKVPQLIVRLIKRCLDADPLIRPTAKEINDILRKWRSQPNDDQTAELQAQIKETDEINNNSSNSNITSANLGISYETHPQAIYTSRLLNFNILPEPKNSDDYYEQNDNIISKKFSECIQFDTSQWNNIN